MRIGIELSTWANRRGYGRFTRGLVRALLAAPEPGEEFVLLLGPDARVDELPPNGERVWLSGPVAPGVVDTTLRRTWRELLARRRALARLRLDVVVFPTLFSYFPPRTSARVIVGIHDTIAEDHPRVVFPNPLDRWLWRAKSALARRRADRLFTVSDYSRRKLERRFGLPPERVAVVGEAADPIFRPRPAEKIDPVLRERAGLGAGERGILFVGGLNPHKNLRSLVDAVVELRRRPALAELRLILVGDPADTFTPGADALHEHVQRAGIEDAVRVLGFLPDTDIVDLLGAADLLALPSLAEGFGLPALEAAACGTPVVATRESPLPEILGDGGLFVDPREPAELRDALRRVLEEPGLRERMGEIARRRAAAHTWERSAEQMREILHDGRKS